MVELNDVLLIAGNGEVRVGRPRLEGARVIAEVVEHGRDRKIVVFKYKSKTRYRRRRGHRQGYTRLAVRQILTAEGPPKAEEKPKRRRVAKTEAKAEAEAKPARPTRARKPKPEAETAEADAKPARRTRARKPEPEADAPEADAKPARRTRARKPAAESVAEKTEEEKPDSGE
jgi:large subunit ribosomal protein L21